MRLSQLCLALATSLSTTTAQSFNWTSITPSVNLTWNNCHQTFQCARLRVPYEHTNTTDPRNFALALVKLPAVVSSDDPAYAGPIFTNPGGPGQIGTDLVLSLGKHMQSTLDKPGVRHYDIIGFDPRGVGNTTPKIQCLDRLQQDVFNIEARGFQGVDMGERSVAYALAMYKSFALACEYMGGDYFEYVGTASVVEDLVLMLDLFQEERGEKGMEPARLLYYGFSYGTVLGNYFASMYPGRVGRMVLDGVVNVHDYISAPRYLTYTENTDALLENFIETCHTAKTACPLYSPSSTATELSTRIHTLIRSLNNNPQGVITPTGKRVVITGHDLARQVGMTGYHALSGWNPLAEIFAAALKGNFTPLFAQWEKYSLMPSLSKTWLDTPPAAVDSNDALYAISCLDGEDVTGNSVEWWVDYAAEMKNVSTIYGEPISQILFACSSWPYKANKRFTGPFTTTRFSANITSDKPAAPLLFVNSRFDPVTPISSARKMAREHPGAGVVVLEAVGHGALTSAPSKCLAGILSEYFDGGVVKEEERVCKAECGPWDEGCSAVKGE